MRIYEYMNELSRDPSASSLFSSLKVFKPVFIIGLPYSGTHRVRQAFSNSTSSPFPTRVPENNNTNKVDDKPKPTSSFYKKVLQFLHDIPDASASFYVPEQWELHSPIPLTPHHNITLKEYQALGQASTRSLSSSSDRERAVRMRLWGKKWEGLQSFLNMEGRSRIGSDFFHLGATFVQKIS